jgi:diguanylate cyclase (GGDEF)-like protein
MHSGCITKSLSDSGWNEFLAGLDQRLAKIADAWGQLEQSPADIKALTTLHHRLHNLGAAAQSFRLEAFGERIEAAEQATLDLLVAGVDVGHDDLRNIRSLIESLLEQGARFRHDARDPGTEVVSETYNPRLIFVVDDDPQHQHYLSEQLQLYGYQVQAFDTLQAMEAGLGTVRPDALVVDRSQSTDDQTCIREIEHVKQRMTRPCPLIFVSNEDGMATRFAAVAAVAAAFFPTPVQMERLVERLDALTARPNEQPLRALVVDDDLPVARLHADFLVSAGMQVEILSEPEGLLQHLQSFAPDLVLMDVFMPRYNGIDLATMMRQHEDFLDVPVVYLSAEKDEKRQIDAIRRGGDDFLSKPVQPSHLISSVLHLAGRYRQQRDNAKRDALTGLFNHTRIRDELRRALKQREISRAPVSLALLCVDDLDIINRHHGDRVGDMVLRSIAHLLHQYHSPGTPMGRIGGSRFALVLPGLSADQARAHLQGLTEKLGGISHRSDSGVFRANLSVGLASAPPAASFDALMTTAEQALASSRKQPGEHQIHAGGAC